jgi:hypothetical protein
VFNKSRRKEDKWEKGHKEIKLPNSRGRLATIGFQVLMTGMATLLLFGSFSIPCPCDKSFAKTRTFNVV